MTVTTIHNALLDAASEFVIWRRQGTDCGAPVTPVLRAGSGRARLWNAVDRHLQPPSTSTAVAAVECGHLTSRIRQLYSLNHELLGDVHLGYPDPADLWAAQDHLYAAGMQLVLHLEIRLRESDEPVLAVHGAGVDGRLGGDMWRVIAPLLTTSSATISEPMHQLPWRSHRQAVEGRLTRLPAGAAMPRAHQIGRGSRTWWEYSASPDPGDDASRCGAGAGSVPAHTSSPCSLSA